MLSDFKQSIYSLWFDSIPEQIVVGAISEVESTMEAEWIKSSCGKIYKNYVVMNTAIFLLTFMNFEQSTVMTIKDENGEDVEVNLKALNETGVASNIKFDSIDSNVKREYYKAVLPEGYDFKDFPYGYLSGRIKEMEDLCKKSGKYFGGISAGRSAPTCSSSGGDGPYSPQYSLLEQMNQCLTKQCKAVRTPEPPKCDSDCD